MKTEEVAKKFGIGKSTVDTWKLKYKKE